MTEQEFKWQDVAEELRPTVMMAVDPLFDATIAHANDTDAEFFRRAKRDLAIILTSDFNCSVQTREQPDSITCVLNLGLVVFFKNLSRAFLSNVHILSSSELDEHSHKPDNKLRSNLSGTEPIEYIRRLADAFWDRRIPTTSQLPNLAPLAESTEAFWNLIVRFGIRFAIAHELAHVLLKRSGQQMPQLLAGIARARFILLQSGRDNRESDARSNDWGMELAADRIGLDITYAATRACEGEELAAFQHWAIWIFFHCCDILWRYHQASRGGLVDRLDRHPPFHVRISELQREHPFRNSKIDAQSMFHKCAEDMMEALCGDIPVPQALGDVELQAAQWLHREARVILTSRGDTKVALQKTDQALQILAGHDADLDRAECLLTRARILQTLEMYTESARSYFFAVTLFALNKSDDAAGIAGKELQDMVNGRPMPERETVANAIRDAAIESGARVNYRG